VLAIVTYLSVRGTRREGLSSADRILFVCYLILLAFIFNLQRGQPYLP